MSEHDHKWEVATGPIYSDNGSVYLRRMETSSFIQGEIMKCANCGAETPNLINYVAFCNQGCYTENARRIRRIGFTEIL